VQKHGAQGIFVCNSDEVAKRCRVFECRNTESSVESEFESILRSPARCGDEYPKLAMLIWFLQDDKSDTSRIGRLKSLFWNLITLTWW